MGKMTYNILICEDDENYVDEIKREISAINSRIDNYTLHLDCGMTPTQCLKCIEDKAYDVIILDVCIKNGITEVATNLELLRSQIDACKYYGTELYEKILSANLDAKIFVLSSLPLYELRRLFNYDQLEYLSKIDMNAKQIAQYMKNYFDSGKKRIVNNIFVVYGHNEDMRFSVDKYIEDLNLHSIDLFNQSAGGLCSVLDALEDCKDVADCAIVLLSADDIVLNQKDLQFVYRARQNVIFEMGLFSGYLGRNKVIVLYEKHDKFEFPSDISGVFYIEYDCTNEWQKKLKTKLKQIGF